MTVSPPPAPMRIDVDSTGVVVSGDVDSATAPGLHGCLTDALVRTAEGPVLVDLTGVTFLDSAGLCVLAVGHREARRAGRVLLLRVGDNRAVTRPLEISGLSELLDLAAG